MPLLSRNILSLLVVVSTFSYPYIATGITCPYYGGGSSFLPSFIAMPNQTFSILPLFELLDSNVNLSSNSISLIYKQLSLYDLQTGGIYISTNGSKIFPPFGVLDIKFSIRSNYSIFGNGSQWRFPSFKIEKKSTDPTGLLSDNYYDHLVVELAFNQVRITTLKYSVLSGPNTGSWSYGNETSFTFRVVWQNTSIAIFRPDSASPTTAIVFLGGSQIPNKAGYWFFYASSNDVPSETMSATIDVSLFAYQCLDALNATTSPTTLPQTSTPSTTCSSDPFGGGTCSSNGTVVYNQSVSLNSSKSIEVTTAVVIIGNFTSDQPISLAVKDTQLTVTGCVDIKNSNLTVILSNSSTNSAPVLNTPCLLSNFSAIVVTSNYSALCSVAGTPQYDGNRFSVLFQFSQSTCTNGGSKKKRRVLLIVLAVILPIIVILAMVAVGIWCLYKRGASGFSRLFRAEVTYDKPQTSQSGMN